MIVLFCACNLGPGRDYSGSRALTLVTIYLATVSCMRIALGQDCHTLGFTVKPRQLNETVIDAGFADDIALLSDLIRC